MKACPSIKSIQRIPIIFLLIVVSYFVISVLACISSVGETKILNVNVLNLSSKTYQTVDIGKNSFQTGTEGRLFWKVKSLKEAFLVGLANRNDAGNFYDILYLLILDLILFIMFFKVKEDSVFSDRIILGLKLLGCSVLVYAFINLISYKIAGRSVELLTNRQFTTQFRQDNIPKYLFLCYLIWFIAPLIKKGISLQQEQDLTI